MDIFLIYFIIVNFVAFIMFGSDKMKAKKNQWRISESNLFLIAFIGGSIGAWGGMYFFRHKTRHWHFKYGIPFILLLQIGLALLFLFN
ncbi:MAG: DUF1294 domain-containing protein [Planctomycetia bacterium]|nr:DUF1294 domain-containing protein [Planctomycetia bacterium]